MLNVILTHLRRAHARRAALLAIAATLVIIVGPFAFEHEATVQGQNLSWHEALYYTLGLFTLSLSRLGYPQTMALRLVLFAAPIVSSAALIGAFVRLLEERGPLFFQRLSNHTGIGGLGNLGATIASHERRRGHAFIAIERNDDAPQVQDLRASGAIVVTGDMTSAEVLRRAGCARARRIFLTASSDVANLDAAFLVRSLVRSENRARGISATWRAPPRIYAHVFDAGLSDAIEHQLRVHDGVEADIITFNSYRFAAKALVALMLRDRLIGSLRIAPGMVLERTDWEARGKRLSEPRVESIDACLEEDRRRLLSSLRLAGAPAAPPRERFAIVGLGRFGRSVAQELLLATPADARFLVIERSADSFASQMAMFPAEERGRFESVIADAGHPDASAQIHAFGPRAVIICTDNDLGNLRVALELKRLDIRTVTRMFDLEATHELSRGLEACGIATVGLAPLFRAAIPILTHERRLLACVNLDYQSTPEVDHLFYLAHVTPEEREELGGKCVSLEDLPRAEGAPEPPTGLGLVWYRAVERLRAYVPAGK